MIIELLCFLNYTLLLLDLTKKKFEFDGTILTGMNKQIKEAKIRFVLIDMLTFCCDFKVALISILYLSASGIMKQSLNMPKLTKIAIRDRRTGRS